MQYDAFVGQVQHRARLASSGEAVRAIHAVLQTLGERLFGDEAEDLAAQLPPEIGNYLQEVEDQAPFGLNEFFERVAAREHADYPDAVFHARAVIAVLKQAVSPGEIIDVRAQLPSEFGPLFDSGAEGQMPSSD